MPFAFTCPCCSDFSHGIVGITTKVSKEGPRKRSFAETE
uniref:Csu456(Uce) n=1 Tax=Arundo donax TaxID=35708 RepID=A0A0A9GHR6_ARUDO